MRQRPNFDSSGEDDLDKDMDDELGGGAVDSGNARPACSTDTTSGGVYVVGTVEVGAYRPFVGCEC